jgi:hypothetical protein
MTTVIIYGYERKSPFNYQNLKNLNCMEISKDKYWAMRKIRDVKTLWKLGEISEAEAKSECEKPLEYLNERMAKIAKEFGKRHKKMTFGDAMRIRNFYI